MPGSPALVALCLSLTLHTAVKAQEPKPKQAGRKGQVEAQRGAPPEDSLPPMAGLKARSIGPAMMGGRVAAIAMHPSDPWTYYVGLGTGGIVKTTDNGGTFKAVFEDQPVAAIGALAVAPSDPKIVWAGTGEANDRNSSSWGDGVYRSTDEGKTWTNVGLRQSKAIADVVVHPNDPATAWVAAVGDLWIPSTERGCYKTTDAGKTWKLVLAAPAPYGDRVGCGELVIDPANPDVLYAALYARRRFPWQFISGVNATDGKDLGGIFKSTDGGNTWKKLTAGLPGRTQRIGLAVYPKNPQIVYAVVQSDEGGTSSIDDNHSKAGGVFRSENGGESWTRVSTLNPRPFYFSKIRVDPGDDRRIYVLGFALHVSDDGGKTWREDRFNKVHPDNHALEIDPRWPKRLLLGTDGGLYQSVDGGTGWEFQNRFAGGEFYRINADRSEPYRICGGLQDNTNWVGPSRTYTKDGIQNADWIQIGGGDGSYCVFDATDSNVVYAESQQGFLFRFGLAHGQEKSIKPEPTEGSPAFRYHWNSPLIQSAHDPRVMYYGADRVFRLTDRGESWQQISDDLSTRDLARMTALGSGAETFGVVYTLAESPVKQGLLWAGTDDGKLWKTENDGGSWTDLTASLPAAIKNVWISRIEASHHDPLVAYVAVDGHRTGKYTPWLFRTADGGKSWQNLATTLPDGGPVKVVREDPKNPSLLFAGTEFGLWASVDRGTHWFKLGKLPTVAVDDILIHPREMDLLAATHGRSIYIVDDIRPLQELTPEVRGKQVHLFSIRPALGRYLLPGWTDWAGTSAYRGENPPEGALISFWVARYTGDEVKIAITNASGQPVANLTAPATPGINRVAWNLRRSKDLVIEYGGEGANQLVPAGDYTVSLTYGSTTEKQTVRVAVAPGVEIR